MAQYDPFADESIDNEPSRGPGRPRTREVREKGSVGRPRIRPIDDPSSRRRGRPTVDVSSVADKIQKEAIISGQITAKSINASVQSLSGVVKALEKGVVNPLARTVSTFSQSINKFNNYHQQYLKDQVAISKQIHESFKMFRKSAIDPVMVAAARMEQGTRYLHETMSQVYEGGYQGVAFKNMKDKVSEINGNLVKFVKYGTLGLETTDTFLKEYYKTSKGTSKFLNSVSYAAEDISEDIEALKTDLQKYFKGKGSKTVLQDQTDALRKIEKNTQGPTLAKRIMSAGITSLIAGIKTAFKYNRYGTTEFISELTGFRMPDLEQQQDMRGQPTKLAKFAKLVGETIDIQTRQVARDASGKIRNVLDTTAGGKYGEFAAGGAEYVSDLLDSLNDFRKDLIKRWDESQTKRRVEWFWKIGQSMFLDAYSAKGAEGERAIKTVITNYQKGNAPHEGRQTGDINRALNSYNELPAAGKKAFREQIRAQDLESDTEKFFKDNLGLRVINGGGKGKDTRSHSWRFDGTGAIKEGDWANPIDPMANILKSKLKGTKGNIVQGPWGKGQTQVNANPESNTKITNGDISNPRRAFASLLKLQIRIHGLLQRMFRHVKNVDKNTDELEEGILDKAKEGLFGGKGLLGGALAGLGATKVGKFLKAGKAGWRGVAIAGGALGAARLAKNAKAAAQIAGASKAMKAGSLARVLWDTFGYGNAAKEGMGALANVKKIQVGGKALGKTWWGRALRQARLASANVGNSAGARIGRYIIHANKWGGVFDPLGATMGYYNAAKTGRNLSGALGATRSSASFLGKIGAGMDKAGAGIIRGVTNAKNFVSGKAAQAGIKLAGLDKVSKIGKIAGLSKAGGLLGGLGKAAGMIFKKVPILGGLFTIGLGLKELIKDHDWKSGLWHLFTGTLMAIPITSLAGTVLALGGDAVHWASNKFKNRQELNPNDAAEEAVKAGQEAAPSWWEKVFGKKKNTNPGSATPAAPSANPTTPSSTPSTPSSTPTSGGTPYTGNTPVRVNNTNKKSVNAVKKGTPQSVYGRAAQATKRTIKKVINQASAATAAASTGAAENSPYINWNSQTKSGLTPTFSSKLAAAAEKYFQATGKKLTITSGVRTNKKQAELYARRHGAGDTSISSNVARPAVSDVVNWKGKQYWVKGKDNGDTMRTGHMAGQAVDVKEWSAFKPYALAQGLTWGGDWRADDYMHFEYRKKAPIVGSASPIKNPPPGAIKVGDMPTSIGPSRETSPTIIPAVSPTNSNSPGASPSANTEISPIIQDYGLAIINNLLFS